MEIDIALDSYDDLFSDFDVRGFDKRLFSRDFLDELNLRMIKNDEEGESNIVLLIPKEKRLKNDEEIIIKRLISFFEDRYKYYCKQNKIIILNSALFVIIGLILLIFANFFSKMLPQAFNDFLLIPSWYFTWAGLEKFVESSKELRGKKKYYSILKDSEIIFRDTKDKNSDCKQHLIE